MIPKTFGFVAGKIGNNRIKVIPISCPDNFNRETVELSVYCICFLISSHQNNQMDAKTKVSPIQNADLENGSGRMNTTSERTYLDDHNGGEIDSYLDVDEKWERIRNGYERSFGMQKVFPKLKAVLDAELKQTKVRNEGLDLLLTQGVDETIARFSSVVLNIALVSALFLSVELSLYASPPSSISDSNAYVKWLYFGLSTIGVSSHFCCLVSAVHILNWYYRLRTDADWIDYCTDFDIGQVRDNWVVFPLVIGIICNVCAIVLSAALSAGNGYFAIPAVAILTIAGLAPIYFSSAVSVFVMNKYVDKPIKDRGIERVYRMYDERAKFDARFGL